MEHLVESSKKAVNVAFLGSRPISLAALKMAHEIIESHPKDWVNLSVFTKSDDNPPPGVVQWWNLGLLQLNAKEMGYPLIKSQEELNAGEFGLMTMVFFNDIIPGALIDKVPHGITNIHFGYLPDINYSSSSGSKRVENEPFSRGTYRGSNVLSHAILQNEAWQAVTFHFISSRIDLGPVIEYAWNPVAETTTAWELQQKSEKKGLELYQNYFERLVDSPQSISTTPPGTEKYPYYDRYSLTPYKVLDPSLKDTEVERIARALSFPNTEPPYFREKGERGKNLRRYVLYKKGSGVVIMDPQEEQFIQKLDDII